jgi:hypothetical protein
MDRRADGGFFQAQGQERVRELAGLHVQLGEADGEAGDQEEGVDLHQVDREEHRRENHGDRPVGMAGAHGVGEGAADSDPDGGAQHPDQPFDDLLAGVAGSHEDDEDGEERPVEMNSGAQVA